MTIIQLNALRLNAVDANIIALDGVRRRGSHAGAPPVVPDVPDIPEEPDVPSDPDVDENGYIIFADPEVKRVLLANGVGDGVGITKEAAAEVTSIGAWFKGNATITSFNEFGKFTKAQAIPANAFNGCTSLGKIDLGNVTSLGVSALYNCSALEIDDLAMPNLTNLGQNAFYGVKIKKISNLGKLTTLPAADTTTQNFGDKDTLEEIVLPPTITTIPQGALYKYSNAIIEDLNLPNLTTIGNGAFNSTKLRNISSLGAVTRFENAARNVGESFENCTELTRLADGVLDNITYMAGAFNGCSNLEIEELRLPSLTGTLTYCLSEAVIKKVLDLGGITVFFGDTALGWSSTPFGSVVEEIIIPATVVSIGRYAFANKANLKEIVMLASTPPTLYSSAFSLANTTSLIYVPDGSVEAYKGATNWSNYAGRIVPLSQLATDNPALYEEVEENL